MHQRTRGPQGGGQVPQYPIESVDDALRLLLLFEERKDVRGGGRDRHPTVSVRRSSKMLTGRTRAGAAEEVTTAIATGMYRLATIRQV